MTKEVAFFGLMVVWPIHVLRNAWALLITKSEALCNRLSEA